MGTVAVARTRVETKAGLNTMNNRIKSFNYLNKHFESSQKLQKDGIGIWENFIRNMLSNYTRCLKKMVLKLSSAITFVI